MKELRCASCGSNDLQIHNNIATCRYCNTNFIINTVIPYNTIVKNPLYVCPNCGYVGKPNKYSKNFYGTCFLCRTKMHKIEPEIEFEIIFSATEQEKEQYALMFQPKEKFNINAWTHRIHMMQGNKIKGWPIYFDYCFYEGVEHPQCPHCGQYWTEKRTALFKKKEYWHCYFCEKNF